MEPGWISSTSEAVIGISVAVLAGAIALRKYIRGWTNDSAENEVVKLLREEIKRMSDQNMAVTTELNRLQIDIIRLHKELQLLTLENGKLHTQIMSLNTQIDRLKTILEDHNLTAQFQGEHHNG